jgi:hypothetical protein
MGARSSKATAFAKSTSVNVWRPRCAPGARPEPACVRSGGELSTTTQSDEAMGPGVPALLIARTLMQNCWPSLVLKGSRKEPLSPT